jgi:type VI secretion system protein ImpM
VPGFYGKLPSHGDFLQRGVNDEFVNHWDAWLQDGLARSRSELGEAAWLDVFLTSPLWRFALGSGVVGGAVWAGILLPSVDRVGRYFPLTLVAELPPGVLPFELAVAGNGWFDWAETLARRTLEEELVDLNRLEAELRESEALLAAVRPPQARLDLKAMAGTGAAACWLGLAPDGDMGRFFARFADGLTAGVREPLGLWWSIGSERVAPSVLMTRGLPPATEFRKLLGGAAPITPVLLGAAIMEMPALPAEPVAVIPPIAPPADPSGGIAPIVAPPTLSWKSAAVSTVGRVRDENQDAFVERAADGVWVVADGMGGHQGGGLASQLVAERVRTVPVTGDLRAAADAVTAAVQSANAELRRRGEAQPGFDGGTTVVALCAHGAQGIALWAGDSRLYRLRGGEVTQLTRDHSVAEEAGAAAIDSHMLTRAVGGADFLALEELRLDLRAGDRLLLCSDGLYMELARPEIAEALAAADCAAAGRRLVELALQRGGADNATAVVIALEDALLQQLTGDLVREGLGDGEHGRVDGA